MLYLLFAALIVAADQWMKYWVVQHIALGETAELFPGVLHLTYVQNTGAAFSMFEGARWVFVGITVLCVILMIVYLFRSSMGPAGKLALGAVLGGAIGNGIDRVLHGYVVDMLEAEFVEYAVCNIADCFIVVGAVVFFICYLVHVTRKEKEKKSAATAAGGEHRQDSGKIREKMLDDSDEKVSETRILEEFDFERRMSEENNRDQNH